VAPIKPGDSVINQNEVVLHMPRHAKPDVQAHSSGHMKQKGWNREKNSSLSVRQMIERGLFYLSEKKFCLN